MPRKKATQLAMPSISAESSLPCSAELSAEIEKLSNELNQPVGTTIGQCLALGVKTLAHALAHSVPAVAPEADMPLRTPHSPEIARSGEDGTPARVEEIFDQTCPHGVPWDEPNGCPDCAIW